MTRCCSTVCGSVAVLTLLSVLQHVVSCQVAIEVDQNAGSSCTTENLTQQSCNDLESVLTLVAMLPALSSDCVEISIQQGEYFISRPLNFTQSVHLFGNGSVTVVFSDNSSFSSNYILFFSEAGSVSLRGIDFEQGRGSIGLSEVTDVIIEDCSFRDFSANAVEVYSCANVTVTGCLFENNGPHFMQKLALRGYAGGLSISIATSNYSAFKIEVGECTFRNNSNIAPENLFQTTTQLLENYQFTGRGGAFAFIVFSPSPVVATLTDLLFEQNYAQSFGGSLYFSLNGEASHHLSLRRLKFYNNQVGIESGGIDMNLGTDPENAAVRHTVEMFDSEFTGNSALYGGAVYVYVPALVSAVVFDNCSFTDNSAVEFGSAIVAVSLQWFGHTIDTQPLHIRNCMFVSNTGGRGGTLSTAYFPLNFYGENKFIFNNGRTLVNVGSQWNMYGEVHSIGSDPAGSLDSGTDDGLDEGALFVVSLGQLTLFHGSALRFDHSRGVLGAAVVVDVPNAVPQVYSKSLFNPLCFLQYQDSTTAPINWTNVSIAFNNNTALIGSAALINNLKFCSWAGLKPPYFNASQVMRWGFVEFGDTNQNTAHFPESFNPEWYVQTPAQYLTVIDKNLTAYPGSELQVQVAVQDELGRPTASIIRVSEKDDRNHFVFNPSLQTLALVKEARLNTTFYILSSLGESYEDELLLESVLGPLLAAAERDSLHLRVSGCPPGYVLAHAPLDSASGRYHACLCDRDDSSIVDCSGTKIILTEGLWGSLSSDEVNSLATYRCPPRYCSCTLKTSSEPSTCAFTYDSNNPDTQCSCNRRGRLCGSCLEGKGVSALLNRCVSCHDASGLLIAVLIVADVAVFVWLLLFARSLESWVYPCAFYIQILPHLVEHFPSTFERTSSYLHYVSSASSFYFVYDFCLFGEMSAVVAYSLRYLPLFIAALTITPTLLFKRYYRKPKSPWHGLWWITLLLYSHVVHTSMTVLQCPLLPDERGHSVSTWYINGTVKCFHGSHAPLGILAVLALLLALFIIVLTALYTCGYLQNPSWLRKAAKVVRQGFKDKYKWWAAVELGRRFVLILSIVAFTGSEFAALLVLMVLTTVFGYLQPFKDRSTNALEMVLAVNTIILLLLRNTENTYDTLQDLVVPSDIVNASESIFSSSSDNSEQCQNGDSVLAITNFSWLLLPFCYFPLLLCACVLLLWLGWRACELYKSKRHSTVASDHEGGADTEAGITIPKKPFTTSVVDINELEDLDRRAQKHRLQAGDITRAGTESATKPAAEKIRQLFGRIRHSFSVKI